MAPPGNAQSRTRAEVSLSLRVSVSMNSFFRAPALLPAAIVLLASGCTWELPSAPQAGPDPANAAAPVRPVTDVSVRGDYQSFRPVAPRSWREQNERVAPQARP